MRHNGDFGRRSCGLCSRQAAAIVQPRQALALRSGQAFTLVELVAVVAIITVVLSLLAPVLGDAMERAELASCGNNLRQMGAGVYLYGSDHQGRIPRGPSEPMRPPTVTNVRYDEVLSNWIWIAAIPAYNAHGTLLPYLSNPYAIYCPSGPESLTEQHIDNLRASNTDAFSSYVYRQLDQTTGDRLAGLGYNDAGRQARALMFDYSQFGPFGFVYTAHDYRYNNIVYLDGHVQFIEARGQAFASQPDDFTGFPADLTALVRRADQICINADYAEHGDPGWAPTLP